MGYNDVAPNGVNYSQGAFSNKNFMGFNSNGQAMFSGHGGGIPRAFPHYGGYLNANGQMAGGYITPQGANWNYQGILKNIINPLRQAVTNRKTNVTDMYNSIFNTPANPTPPVGGKPTLTGMAPQPMGPQVPQLQRLLQGGGLSRLKNTDRAAWLKLRDPLAQLQSATQQLSGKENQPWFTALENYINSPEYQKDIGG